MIRSCAAPKHKRTHSAARPCEQLEVSCSHKGYIWLWLSVLQTSSSPHLSSIFTAPCMQRRCIMLLWLRVTLTPSLHRSIQHHFEACNSRSFWRSVLLTPIWIVLRNLTFGRVTSLLHVAYNVASSAPVYTTVSDVLEAVSSRFEDEARQQYRTKSVLWNTNNSSVIDVIIDVIINW